MVYKSLCAYDTHDQQYLRNKMSKAGHVFRTRACNLKVVAVDCSYQSTSSLLLACLWKSLWRENATNNCRHWQLERLVQALYLLWIASCWISEARWSYVNATALSFHKLHLIDMSLDMAQVCLYRGLYFFSWIFCRTAHISREQLNLNRV